VSERVLYSLLIGAAGITVGYLAQRSRMCFVAGLRDYILVRDRELLAGLFSFLLTVWALSSVFYAVGLLDQRMPEYGDLPMASAAGSAGSGGGGARGLPAALQRLRSPGSAGPASADGAGAGGIGRSAHEALIGVPVGGLRGLFGRFFWTSLGGGVLIGFLSVLAGGCVLRQHVLCAQGNRNALFFVLGFYAAAVAVGLFLIDRLSWFYG
jgi:uncharacterized membrane protein YedE/YeeE